jgi:nucleoside-diphosphate-sugar epimerase
MPEILHRVVVTGATGFVGRALASRLGASVDTLHFGAPDWRLQLKAANLEGATIFHLAGRVHVTGSANEAAFLEDNEGKTRALGEAAAREGARRIVFLSTIKVHGEESPGRPFNEDDPPAPQDAYARSKLAAEQALTMALRGSGVGATIVRSPLVYGADARANLASLLRLADTPWPLPFAALAAERSFVHVDDLIRLLVDCAQRPESAGRTYIAAHRRGVSGAQVVTLMRRALGRAPRLFAVAPAAIEAAAALLGQRAKALRLTRALLGDPSAAERELGWIAKVPIEQAVEDLVRDYRARVSH